MEIQILTYPRTAGYSKQCSELHHLSFAAVGVRKWSEKEFLELFNRKNIILLLTPYSFLIADITSGEAEIITFCVHPEKLKKGNGSKLLDLFFVTCTHQKVDCCTLEVAVDNIAAINLYKKHDFENVGIRKNYFRRGKFFVSALIMKKSFA